MGGRRQLLPWGIYEVQDDRIEGAGSCEASNTDNRIHIITNNIWRAYSELWYGPQTISNAACDFSTRK